MTTRLTKSMRQSIITAILADIPHRDFAQIGREELLEAAVEALPAAVKRAWKDPATQAFVNITHLYTDCGGITASVPGARDAHRGPDVVGPEAWDKFRDRCGDKRKQADERSALAAKLHANFAGIASTKTFAERFPDLARYLPAETVATANLPATTDLIDALALAGLPALKAA